MSKYLKIIDQTCKNYIQNPTFLTFHKNLSRALSLSHLLFFKTFLKVFLSLLLFVFLVF